MKLNYFYWRVKAIISEANNYFNKLFISLGIGFLSIAIIAMPGLLVGSAQAASHMSGSSLKEVRGNSGLISLKSADSQSIIRIAANLKGAIGFNEHETKITEFPSNSYLDINVEQKGQGKKRLLIQSDHDDSIDYFYYVDGVQTKYDLDGQSWFSGILPYVFRATGFDAQGRVNRIKQNSGDSSVLDEIELIGSDSIQSAYIKYLLEITKLSEIDTNRALDIAKLIDSDKELASVLASVARTQGLTNELWVKILMVSKSVESDVDMMNFLAGIASRIPADSDIQSRYLSRVGSIQSDSVAKNLFSLLLNSEVSDKFFSKILLEAGQITSDSELSNLLVEIKQKTRIKNNAFSAYLETAKTIQSDGEMSKVFVSLVDATLDDELMERLLAVAKENISSDDEMKKVLSALYKSRESL